MALIHSKANQPRLLQTAQIQTGFVQLFSIQSQLITFHYIHILETKSAVVAGFGQTSTPHHMQSRFPPLAFVIKPNHTWHWQRQRQGGSAVPEASRHMHSVQDKKVKHRVTQDTEAATTVLTSYIKNTVLEDLLRRRRVHQMSTEADMKEVRRSKITCE